MRRALGLYGFDDFAIVAGRDAARSAGKSAAWYFADEVVAIPREGLRLSEIEPGVRALHDLRRFADAHEDVPLEWPPLVWMGAADVVRDARISADASTLHAQDRSLPLTLVDNLPLNQSWFDATSAAFFANEAVMARGTVSDGGFQARVLWPERFTLGPVDPSGDDFDRAKPAAWLRARVREPTQSFAAHTFWHREGTEPWAGKTVLAFILNGAQGDDDEAHAGHFAIATGRIADDGAIGDWLVASFYSLDIVSEKGIIAAPVPLANYQADLNSGQSWYRPTWILVAALDNDRAPRRVQAGLNRMFLHFWRHQITYYHPLVNCTSLSVDTLRALGLQVPLRGPTSIAKAWLALPWLLLRERSVEKAKTQFDYLVADRTRLLPQIALEAVLEALVGLTRTSPSGGALANEIAHDLVALAFIRLPQFPSSRTSGGPPVASLDEYQARLPRDRTKMKIVPVPARPFPDGLRDDDLLPALPKPSDLALRAWIGVPVALLAAVLVALVA
ncbi:MAG TPA: hypothetical protein VNE58_11830 [Casimicrobiaceae bacterium]|nr:hypothetical protein [Casimicrobiaceae bacterium]